MPHRQTPHPLAAQVGSRIRALREERGLSLGELARATRISKGSLSGIERGLVLITIATLARIARGLDLAAAQVIAFPDG